MKHLRTSAKSGMAAKLARMKGSDASRVMKGMPSRDGSKGYANGGMISGESDTDVDGVGAKPRMGKPAKMKGGKGDKKGTNVNIVIMPKEGGAGPMMPPSPAAGAPGPMPPPGPPPGGPPMPMRARGGRVHSDAAEDKKMIAKMIHKHEAHDHKGTKETKFKRGGSVKGGAGGALGRLAKLKSYGPKAGKGC